ncbi:MAG: Carboxy-terminal processing protease CtpB precursor [Candidatus Izimaplasma bacterium HR2]|nr:MAG: Carboxy-terminal processing protease CtpB precursor [Candidatus Izimaplasma bacterium HR2]
MFKKIFLITLVFAMSLTLVGCKKEYVIETCEITGEADFPENEIEYDLLSEVIYTLEGTHYSLPTRESLIEGAIEGVINSLDDPFTMYYDSDEVAEYYSHFEESYLGIGVIFKTLDDSLIIKEVIEGGPAETAGIKTGDIIASIDGVSTLDKPYAEVSELLIGYEGDEVNIGVFRTGVEDILVITITRGIVDYPSVKYQTIERDNELIGYIKIRMFADSTAKLFLDALSDLESQGIDSLIIDLRGDRGGRMSTTTNILKWLLVYNDVPMVYNTRNHYGRTYSFYYYGALSEPKDYDIVTLVNERSASAAEIFSSAMQEHGGYTLIGTTTYGKGVGQNIIELTEAVGDGLRVTTVRWFTAEGNWVQEIGVIPDIIQELNMYEEANTVFLSNIEVIKYDTVGERVANIQVVLNLMGYTVRTDGYYDLATKEAVMEIQTNNSLPVTGNINSDTLVIINEALSVYQNDPLNDSQLEAALDYLTGN